MGSLLSLLAGLILWCEEFGGMVRSDRSLDRVNQCTGEWRSATSFVDVGKSEQYWTDFANGRCV